MANQAGKGDRDSRTTDRERRRENYGKIDFSNRPPRRQTVKGNKTTIRY